MHWLASWLPFLLAVLVGITTAQSGGDTRLTIRLRASDGRAVTGETIILERLPEEEPMLCVTDQDGACVWRVGRGLYQVLFTRPLDDISALAVAEGGLRGLGITMGDASVTYHFTFHSDGRVYFDAAPDAAVPSPLIPIGEARHGGSAPTPALPAGVDEPAEVTPTPEPTNAPDTAVRTTSGSSWRLILFIGGGLVIGGGLHLLRRRAKPILHAPKGKGRSGKQQKPHAETTQPKDEETPHA
ncbi:MAG: hypothetical protein KJ069_23125 [Anaerolineae bacterium]|nr:hypothetical protein [Anaerolineae bacterium]